jgi:hypothetical protein
MGKQTNNQPKENTRIIPNPRIKKNKTPPRRSPPPQQQQRPQLTRTNGTMYGPVPTRSTGTYYPGGSRRRRNKRGRKTRRYRKK